MNKRILGFRWYITIPIIISIALIAGLVEMSWWQSMIFTGLVWLFLLNRRDAVRKQNIIKRMQNKQSTKEDLEIAMGLIPMYKEEYHWIKELWTDEMIRLWKKENKENE